MRYWSFSIASITTRCHNITDPTNCFRITKCNLTECFRILVRPDQQFQDKSVTWPTVSKSKFDLTNCFRIYVWPYQLFQNPSVTWQTVSESRSDHLTNCFRITKGDLTHCFRITKCDLTHCFTSTRALTICFRITKCDTTISESIATWPSVQNPSVIWQSVRNPCVTWPSVSESKCDLTICRLTETSGPVAGGKEILLFCEKEPSADLSHLLPELYCKLTWTICWPEPYATWTIRWPEPYADLNHQLT